MFKITRPGIYTVPNWGRIDASKEVKVSPERLLLLFEYSGFPWIEINKTTETLKWLKSQKIVDSRLVKMIQQCHNVADIEFLKEITKKKHVLAIADTRIKALSKD